MSGSELQHGSHHAFLLRSNFPAQKISPRANRLIQLHIQSNFGEVHPLAAADPQAVQIR